LLIIILLMMSCKKDPAPSYPDVDREDKIPSDISKGNPSTDQHPPILYSNEFHDPVPMDYPISTAGAEDSPFILPDGNTIYFFFTPDVRIPVEQQIYDEVSGTWVSHKQNGVWSKPTRVWLNDPGVLSMDGAVSIQNDEMWFASAREGYTMVNIFTARWKEGKWADWTYSGDRLMKEIRIGEVHIHGDDLYFHSDRPGGKGDYDVWVTNRSNGNWSDPVNIEAVNTETMDGFPFISSDGTELWFTRTYLGTPAVYRSVIEGQQWGEPEMIVSQFAGEPTLDDAGNLYFIHHFYEDGVMIEADIYVALRK
jgi:hypothetical protein